MKNGDCRIPRAQQLVYKTIRREEWEKLHHAAYNMLDMMFPDDNWIDTFIGLGESDKVILERLAKEWRKYIALPTNCERWLEDRRNARANEIIPD